MESKEQKLVSLLQLRDYKSKIKLYCKDCESKIIVQKFGSLIIKPYICQVKIQEL